MGVKVKYGRGLVGIPKHRSKHRQSSGENMVVFSEAERRLELGEQNTKFRENTRDPRIDKHPARETPAPRKAGHTCLHGVSLSVTILLCTQYPRWLFSLSLFKCSKIETPLFALGANMPVESISHSWAPISREAAGVLISGL